MLSPGIKIKAVPLSWGLVVLGIVLRLAWYLPNRSLWWDEAALALNLGRNTFMALMDQPLLYEQAAPIGFLWLSKLLTNLLGNSEYVLRFLPLSAGILSLFLFRRLVLSWLEARAAVIALGLFAVSEPLLRYATEFKQYSFDVLATIIMLLLVAPLLKPAPRTRDYFLPGLAGALAIWFSHASIFVLAAAGISLALPAVSRRQWRQLTTLSVTGGIWLLSFGLSYLLYVQDAAASEKQVNFWGQQLNMGGAPEGGAFMPLAVSSLADLKVLLLWVSRAALDIMENPGGMLVKEIAAFLFIAGCVTLFHRSRRRLAMLLVPLLLALLASAMQKYPFHGRLLLYSAPLIIMIVAAGAEEMLVSLRDRFPILSFTLMAMLLAPQAANAGWRLVKPYRTLQIRQAVDHVSENCRPGDRFYVSHAAAPLLEYYSHRLTPGCRSYEIGRGSVWRDRSRDDWNDIEKDIDGLRGNSRVWFLSAYVPATDQNYLRYYLDRTGHRIDSYATNGILVLLYDLSGERAPLLQFQEPGAP